ncbi:MAG: TonB family protein [Pirellulales bacterium]
MSSCNAGFTSGEYGRTSVAITLVAASKESETTDRKVLDDVTEPVETPEAEPPPKKLETPLDTSAKAIEPVMLAEAPTASDFKAPAVAVPEVVREEEIPEEEPPEEVRRAKKKPVAAKPETELIEANAEVNYLTQQSTGVDVPPSVRARPDPTYPVRLIPYRVKASVKVAVTVGADGRVEKITVLESSGYEDMDQSAVETIRERWVFDPALKGEQKVAHEVMFSVNFSVSTRGGR